MSKSRRIPAYVHHKPTGQARVRINGHDHYLGKYGSSESHDAYDEKIAEFLDDEPKTTKTLTTILAAWWRECKSRYTRGKGKLGGAQNWRGIIRLLRTHHGNERAEDLGPVRLRKLLEKAAEENGWSLRYTKMQLARVKQIFKWAASEEMVSLNAFQKLETISIRRGRKTPKFPPVDIKLLAKTLRLLPPKIAAMVRLQRLTGMRPGELVTMRAAEVDRSKFIWVYTPDHHKSEHHDKVRAIFIGPRAQAILAPWILKAGDGFIFPSKGGRAYTSDSYRRAIQRICERHGLPSWSPHQLRKSSATRIRAALDVEHAASALGHSSATVTGDHYAAADRQRAIEAARKLG